MKPDEHYYTFEMKRCKVIVTATSEEEAFELAKKELKKKIDKVGQPTKGMIERTP